MSPVSKLSVLICTQKCIHVLCSLYFFITVLIKCAGVDGKEIHDVCAISNDTVLLAYGAAGLREYSLSCKQVLNHASVAIRDVHRVAFDSATDTLLLLVRQAKNATSWVLVTLRRGESEWIEVNRYNVSIPTGSNVDPTIAVCGSHLESNSISRVHCLRA